MIGDLGLGIRAGTGVALLTLSFAVTLSAQSGVAHVTRDTVDAALAKGGVLVERPQVRISGVHRDKPGALETQQGNTILYITDGEGTFVAGGQTQRLAQGDVLVVPAGMTQALATVAAPIRYLQIVVPPGSKKMDAFAYAPAEKVAATMEKAAPLVDGPNFRVSGGHRPANTREASPVAEVHANEADLFYVVDGRATQMLGGAVIGGRDTGPGQIRGPKTEGGQTYQLGEGDIMWVPAGMPHWFPEIPEALSYLLVKVFYEPVAGSR